MTRSEIDAIRELLALRRAGEIAAIHCNSGNLTVHFHDGKVLAARPKRYVWLVRVARAWLDRAQGVAA